MRSPSHRRRSSQNREGRRWLFAVSDFVVRSCAMQNVPPAGFLVLSASRIALLIFFVSLLPTRAAAQSKPPATPQQIVITHVTVINPGTSSVMPNATIVIEGARIAAVSTTSAPTLTAKNARVIDGSGRYLIPGLWDMHVHTAFGDWFPGGRDIILPLFIANGVIGVRDMGGDVPVLLGWRKQIAAGEIIGPRMMISGPMLDAVLPD